MFMNRRRSAAILAAGVSFALLTACGSGTGGGTATTDPGSTDPGSTDPGRIPVLAEDDRITRGPSGEAAEPASVIEITSEDAAAVKGAGYTAALIWEAQTPFFETVSRGAIDVFKEYGIEVVAQAQYNLNPAEQKRQVETVMALEPDIILTIAGDPVISGEALKPAVDAGVKIVLLSTQVQGWTAGKEFVGMVTGDQAAMGAAAADALAAAVAEDAEIGLLYHDANFFVTNRRDQMAKTQLVVEHPGLKIVSEQGFVTPDQAEALTSGMLVQNPEIQGIYGAWDAVTQSALSALNAAGRKDVKVVTMDLSPVSAVNLVTEGQIVAIISERTYDLGTTMAKEAILALRDRPVPPFVVVPAVTVTKDTIVDDWFEIQHVEVPAEVLDAMGR